MHFENTRRHEAPVLIDLEDDEGGYDDVPVYVERRRHRGGGQAAGTLRLAQQEAAGAYGPSLDVLEIADDVGLGQPPAGNNVLDISLLGPGKCFVSSASLL